MDDTGDLSKVRARCEGNLHPGTECADLGFGENPSAGPTKGRQRRAGEVRDVDPIGIFEEATNRSTAPEREARRITMGRRTQTPNFRARCIRDPGLDRNLTPNVGRP